MFTEYIFGNKKYELTVRDLKATLFDIVAMEQKKLSEIEVKAEKEINEEIRQELVEICTQQNNCLKKVLILTNEIAGNLEMLDSYSKKLKELEDRNVAAIMATLEERQGLAKEEIEFDASKANIGVVSAEESDLNNQMTEGTEEEQVAIASEEADSNNQTTEETDEEQEDVAASTLPETGSVIPIVVSNNDLVQNSEVADDMHSSEESDISLPPLNPGESQVTDNMVGTNNDINIPLIEVPVVNNQDGSIIQDNIAETQQEPNSNEEDPKLTFSKTNGENPKAILTSRVQNEKLRASKDTQKALLNVRGSMGSLEVGQPDISDVQVSEQQLINSGLLQAPTINAQQQIEEMLEQANALYKAGKSEEAQALYDKISILNSQSQANNGISK